MSKRYPDPSPPQGELDLGPFALIGADPLKVLCVVTPQRFGQDQLRCTVCGIVWDIDEARPDCANTST